MNRLSDLRKYKGTLPYASEMFGVYQPLLGWKSSRKMRRQREAFDGAKGKLLSAMLETFRGDVKVHFTADGELVREVGDVGVNLNPDQMPFIDLGKVNVLQPSQHTGSLVLDSLSAQLQGKDRLSPEDWAGLISREGMVRLLKEQCIPQFAERHNEAMRAIRDLRPREGESAHDLEMRRQGLILGICHDTQRSLERESAMAGALVELVEKGLVAPLEAVFYDSTPDLVLAEADRLRELLAKDFEDPYLTFDPKQEIANVSVSPIGIVHLYRQFFFELDSFLGTPVGHVWLSPGSSAELYEVTQTRSLTEKTFESSFESTHRAEELNAREAEISDATKEDNRSNSKAGFSTNVNASYATVSISAGASLNLDRSQQVSREISHKEKRQQSSKLSSEIRQSYKTTFRTVTEVTDTSSKRYLLANNSPNLINYEMRRKMRQVAVQVQDMGTYLCWETFVDEPGQDLGLANLIHIAKPADLVPQPDQTQVPRLPESRVFFFSEKFAWQGGDRSVMWEESTGIIWGAAKRIDYPEHYLLDEKLTRPEQIYSCYGVDSGLSHWAFRFKVSKDGSMYYIGLYVDQDYRNHNNGFNVDEVHDFSVSGEIHLRVDPNANNAIDSANAAKIAAGEAANRENLNKQHEAFIKAAKDRITAASKIKTRKFEELREEERTIIYRRLIESLVTSSNYFSTDQSDQALRNRHVFSELLNSIFDIDKMLYFVAPEWWKPRSHSHQQLFESPAKKRSAKNSKQAIRPAKIPAELRDSVTNWGGMEGREDNYYITEESEPARLGSSLGWLLQLDGDNPRNAFLNAPWVKAVMPVRPGKEMAAIMWLQNVGVEGTEGLDFSYGGSPEELRQITETLAAVFPEEPASNPPTVMDAIRFLCIEVEAKNLASLKVEKYPKDPDIHDDEKVSSTPIEKVYEHGFYPLQGGFRANPNPDDPADPNEDPNNADRHFNVFSQWLEILPTDQVVPVPVEYDPITGRMKQL
ncbi:MAG: peptidoglycan-binding protein [Bacteroidia bacterium]